MVGFVTQLVNVALALLFWLIVGLLGLTALIGDRPNFFLDLLRRPTDPIYPAVAGAMPASFSVRLVPWLSLPLLLGLRVMLLPLPLTGP